MDQPHFVHYLPIATTGISVVFLALISARAIPRKWPPHLTWWAVGIFFYGLGTALESTVTLRGNSAELTRWWYWAGAILGGYPLATGTVYLLLSRKLAHALTGVSVLVVIAASVAVFLTPLVPENVDPVRPSGTVLEWQWVRLMTPIINIYALVFLVGGAMYSTIRYAFPGLIKADDNKRNGKRAAGTALIALGGLLPGIGGTLTKTHDLSEALYIGELSGLLLIWAGYELCIRSTAPRASSDCADTVAREAVT